MFSLQKKIFCLSYYIYYIYLLYIYIKKYIDIFLHDIQRLYMHKHICIEKKKLRIFLIVYNRYITLCDITVMLLWRWICDSCVIIARTVWCHYESPLFPASSSEVKLFDYDSEWHELYYSEEFLILFLIYSSNRCILLLFIIYFVFVDCN